MRKCIFILGIILGMQVQAQDAGLAATNLLFKNEFTANFSVHSSGLAIGMRRAWHPNALKKRAIEFEYSNLKHPKEVKIFHPFEGGRGYFFGKLNNLTTARIGYGQEPVIVGKTDRGSIEIRYLYYGGLSAGFVKPVYLEIIYPTEVPGYYITKVERYDPLAHNVNNIAGRAGFTEGMDEINLALGGYGKVGFNFEYSKEQETVMSLELGVAFDYFPGKPQIMANDANKRLFTSYYISLHYGLKWN